MQDFELLGQFYLGKAYDPVAGAVSDDIVLYDAKDLTTHGVIVGMTGSGKTGLAVSIIEEAAIDGVPVLAIDPKGDLGNLLLAFPDLSPADFRPWVDEQEAARKGMTADAYAAETAATWRKGLAAWGQDPARVARYRDAARATIYTPGSTAGVPLTVLKSFAAPPPAVRDDAEALRERVVATTSGLLALLGLDADPVRSREHILVATLLEGAWREGRDLDVAGLLRAIQQPPFDRLGVLDLESFFPAKDRTALAMALNGLVASPGFSAWTQGEPLDVGRLLWTPEGAPRVSVVSIAHLSDAERMFFVTALLSEVVAWMRAQSGTSSLRALLYMDEVFGYFPPTANPPSKGPMLTLLKQARAYGLGVLLATQNPVDLDYKGLGNAGTWFLGRLQTERDKARIVDGLEGASAAAGAFDRARLEATISGLKNRVFLMVNAHDDAPTLFQTRWALSYLRGPLTKPQIQALTAARRDAGPAAAAPSAVPYGARPAPAAPTAAAGGGAPGAGPGATAVRPVVPPDVVEVFLPAAPGGGGHRLEYRPGVLANAKLHYVDAKAGVDVWEAVAVRAPLPDETALDPWDAAEVLRAAPTTARAPDAGATFSALPGSATRAKTYAAWQKALEEWLFRTRPLSVYRCAELKEASRPGETEGDFRVRLGQLLRERRDREVEALKRKWEPKVTALADRVRAAEERVAREQSQASQQKLQTTLSWGATILGAIFGRGKIASAGTIGRATTAARGIGRASKEAADVTRAEEGADVLRARLAELQKQVEDEIAALRTATDPGSLALDEVRVAPRKGDLSVGTVALLWTPWRVLPDGTSEPAR
ncbi:MAG: DUF853 family protein [Planctomycetes bacterium]|nr:DUF853 family protein [Planctomycetota bacterium]